MAGEYLPPVVTELKAEIDDVLSKVAQVKAAIASIKGDSVEINVKADGVAQAAAQIAALKKNLTTTVNVKTDGLGTAAAKVAALGAATKNASTATGNSIPVWHRWLDLIHFGFAVLGENIFADIIGIVAFATSAVSNLSPAFEAVSNLGKTFGYLNNQQKAAAESITQLRDRYMGAVNTGVFAAFYGIMNLINGVLGQSGGVTRQATQAFEYFAAILQRDFASPQWAQVFGRSSSLVRTDLETLMHTLSAFIQLIPGLLHDFNFLGLAFLNTLTGAFRFLAWISETNPALTRLIYLVYLAQRAFKYLWVGMGTGPGPIQRLVVAIGAGAAKVREFAQAVSILGVSGGIEYMTGLTLATVGALGAVGLLAVGIGALYLATRNYNDVAGNTITTVSLMDKANQNSLPVWQKGLAMLQQQAKALDKNTSSYKAFNQVTGVASRYIQPYNADLARVTDAMNTQSAGIANLRNNFGYLERTYHLTAAQAAGLASQLGLSMNKAFGPTERTMIANYEQAVRLSHEPLKAVAYDMQQASNSALALDDQVTALKNAFDALATPFNNTIEDTVTFKQDLATLTTNLKASNGQVGFGTVAQQNAAQAMAAAAKQAMQLSEDIKQQTGSTQKAMGPIQQMINYLKSLHSHSALVAQEIRILQQYIDQLHSKSITITSNFVTNGTVPTIAGGAPPGSGGQGHVATPPGPQNAVMRLAPVANSAAPGAVFGGSIHIYIDGKEVRSSIARATFEDNFANGSRLNGGRPTGLMRPR